MRSEVAIRILFSTGDGTGKAIIAAGINYPFVRRNVSGER
jgi:hypothetical protein